MNFIYSTYQYEFYAYNLKDAGFNYEYFQNCYKKKPTEENLKIVEEWRWHNISWAESKNEWGIKLVIDSLGLILIIFLKKHKQII